MKKQKLAYIYAMTAVLFWSTAASAFKIMLRYVDFLQLLLFSSLTSLAVLFLILLFQRKFALLLSCSKRDCARSFFMGMLNPFLCYKVKVYGYF